MVASFEFSGKPAKRQCPQVFSLSLAGSPGATAGVVQRRGVEEDGNVAPGEGELLLDCYRLTTKQLVETPADTKSRALAFEVESRIKAEDIRALSQIGGRVTHLIFFFGKWDSKMQDVACDSPCLPLLL
jgi:hypothetical protein